MMRSPGRTRGMSTTLSCEAFRLPAIRIDWQLVRICWIKTGSSRRPHLRGGTTFNLRTMKSAQFKELLRFVGFIQVRLMEFLAPTRGRQLRPTNRETDVRLPGNRMPD